MSGFPYQGNALVGETPGGCDVKRKQAAPWFDLDLPKDRMRSTLDLAGQLGIAERSELIGVGGIEHPYQTRAISWQGHQREGPARRMKFCRRVVMRARMFQADRQRDLRIPALMSCDTGGATAHRSTAIGANGERCVQGAAALEEYGGQIAVDRDIEYFVFGKTAGWQRTGPLLQRFDQMSVFDVVAKGFEANFT